MKKQINESFKPQYFQTSGNEISVLATLEEFEIKINYKFIAYLEIYLE